MRSERVPVALSPCFHFPAGRLSGLGGGAVTAHNVADLFPTLQHHSERPADGHGGAPLVLRQNRQTGVLFTGCSAYPGCAFTEPHDPRVQTLSTGVVQALHTLATQVAQVQTAAQQQLAQAQVEAQRQAAERATLDHTVRQLIALAPPDR